VWSAVQRVSSEGESLEQDDNSGEEQFTGSIEGTKKEYDKLKPIFNAPI